MARSRMYGWNGELPAKAPTGQAQIVLAGLGGDNKGVMKTGHEWAAIIGPQLATRQDPYRVVLYYILALKKAGCIATKEFDINAETRNEDVRHAITVTTASEVKEREFTDAIEEMRDAVRRAQEELQEA